VPSAGGTAFWLSAVPEPKALFVLPKAPVVPDPPAPKRPPAGLFCGAPNAGVVVLEPEPKPANPPPEGVVPLPPKAEPEVPPLPNALPPPKPVLVVLLALAVFPNRPPPVVVLVPKPVVAGLFPKREDPALLLFPKAPVENEVSAGSILLMAVAGAVACFE